MANQIIEHTRNSCPLQHRLINESKTTDSEQLRKEDFIVGSCIDYIVI